jgi:hypothetical protein
MNEVAASLLILLFTYAALTKLFDYQNFLSQLGNSPFLVGKSRLVSIIIPFSEIGISLLLCLRRTRLAGFYSSFFLMLLFSEYIYLILHFSYYIPCSCGGVLSKMN